MFWRLTSFSLVGVVVQSAAIADVNTRLLKASELDAATAVKANATAVLGHIGAGVVPTSDFNPEIPINEVIPIWPEESTMGLTLECIFAMLWITMVAAVPLILPMLDKSPITNTQFTLSWLMWLALFGGVYLFTTTIKFQSAHFSTVRPLTVVECVYLMSQVITTVGYGDITPALPRGQVFVALYVLASMLVIAMLVSDLAGHIISSTQDYETELAISSAQQTAEIGSVTATDAAQGKPPSAMPLVRAIVSFILFASLGIFFFHYFPGEEKPWFQATYMSIITLSTVGFGAVLPTTEMGKVFGAFWMIFGSAALVSVITAFTELMAQLNEYERVSAQKTLRTPRTTSRIDEVAFFKLACVRKGICLESDLDDLDALFDHLQPDYADQSLDVGDVEEKFASIPAEKLGKAQGEDRRKQQEGEA